MFWREKKPRETGSRLSGSLTLKEESRGAPDHWTGVELTVSLEQWEQYPNEQHEGMLILTRSMGCGDPPQQDQMRLTRSQLDSLVRTFGPLLGYVMTQGRA